MNNDNKLISNILLCVGAIAGFVIINRVVENRRNQIIVEEVVEELESE